MGTLLLIVVAAPFMLAAWAATSFLRTLPELAVICALVWIPAALVGAYLNINIQHEYELLSLWGVLLVLTMPLVYAFTVGAIGQFLILATTRRESDQEKALRLVSLAVMVGLPVWFLT